MDKYSNAWSWKLTGSRAVGMASQLIPQSWYGDGPDEVIVPDKPENVERIKQIMGHCQLEVRSKSAWQRRAGKEAMPGTRKTAPIERLSKATPGSQFRGKLLGFQREGLDFLMKSNGNALLADEMGLGKTVQTLAYIATERSSFPVLVVAPLVTLKNWEREIDKFLKRRSKNGRMVDSSSPTSKTIRRGRRQALEKSDFYIINYELLEKRVPDFLKVNLKTLVCDEVHHMRSKTTKKHSAIRKISAMPSLEHRIGLSGTPIYNHGSEIWPIVDVVSPGLLGSYSEFCQYFCYVNSRGKSLVLENKRRLLREKLHKHVMLRRKKSEVLKDLQDKVRYQEYIDADIDYYRRELRKIWNRLKEEELESKTSLDKYSSYQRAIQSERQVAGLAKMPHVINFVQNIMEIEESVVVFCHHKSIHKLLNEKLAEFEPRTVIGGQSDRVRQENIDSFQDGQSDLMIAGLRAGNVGINLSKARYVIFAELDWSPAVHQQAEDRLHRIGQKNTVFAYYLIGNRTLDEHVADILVNKSYEIDAILDGEGQTFENKEKAQLILAQIQDLLRSSPATAGATGRRAGPDPPAGAS